MGIRSIPADECGFCRTSRRDLHLSDYRGCRFCRNSRAEFGAGPNLDGMKICTAAEWLESKEREWAGRGGFSAFCQKYNLDEAKHRKEATAEEDEDLDHVKDGLDQQAPLSARNK